MSSNEGRGHGAPLGYAVEAQALPSLEPADHGSAARSPARVTEAPVLQLPVWARRRPLLLALSALLVALPFLAVTFPPVTDLPQHVAQVRLLHEALQDPGGLYRVQPFTPYWSVYGILAALWAVVPPLQVGRLGVLALGLLWVGGVHALAWRRGRTAEAAVLASLPFFNHTLYWGFASFLVGWPVFLLWLQRVSRPAERSVRTWAVHAALAALLFWSHALWFAAGCLTLGVQWLLQHRRGRGRDWVALALQASAVLPTGLFALWWYPQLSQRGFDSPTRWIDGFYERLSVGGLGSATFGGLHGAIEGPLFLALLAWLGVGLWQARRELRARVDLPLLATALLFFTFVLVLPNEHSNTIRLAERWMPFCFALLLLALPSPQLRARTGARVVLLLALFLSVSTALAWHRFQRKDLAGLRTAIEALPENPRVLGLDFLRTSATVKGRPFLQVPAYAQVLRGGQLGFSFADFAPSPVVYRETGRRKWTRALEWHSSRVKPKDFTYFDFVLVGATPNDHAIVRKRWPTLEPVTSEGRWRLYRVVPEEGAIPAAAP